MKKYLFALACVLSLSFASAQTANKVQINGKVLTIQTANSDSKSKSVNTGYKWKIDGKEYPIMRGPRGGYYVEVNGKKKYLPKEAKLMLQTAESKGK